MMDLIRESGWGAWFTILIFVAGLAAVFTVGRARKRPGSVAAAFAVAILAAGALGMATGQRSVDRAVHSLPETDLAQKIEWMTIGTREAATNLLLAGAGAMLLVAIGGVMALLAGRRAD
jgi:hypothetical protein